MADSGLPRLSDWSCEGLGCSSRSWGPVEEAAPPKGDSSKPMSWLTLILVREHQAR
jgi:hypothetical protein